MSESSYSVLARSAAPPEAVFAVLADGARWSEWAGPLAPKSSWEREGASEPGGVGAIRKLGSWPVFSREEIVAYDPPKHLAYTLLSGMPVNNYRADVELTPDGAGTVITWSGHFTAKIPGTGPLFAAFFRRVVGGFAKRLAATAAAKTAPS